MQPPFTTDQFFDVFRRYNEAVWPSQWLLFLLAGLTLMLTMSSEKNGRTIAGILGFLWLWMALAYHVAFFRTINTAAIGFAVLFTIEGILFLVTAATDSALEFRFRRGFSGVAGLILTVYALLVYPVLGYALGHRYPATPTFGLPCPTTIFTFGILLWARPSLAWKLALVPVIWVLIGSQAVFAFGMWEDLGLIAGGMLFLVGTWQNRRSCRERAVASVLSRSLATIGRRGWRSRAVRWNRAFLLYDVAPDPLRWKPHS